jgi:hypothetical protein
MSDRVEDALKHIKEADLLIQLNPRPKRSRSQYTLPALDSTMSKRMFMPENPYFALPAPSQASSDSTNGSSPNDSGAQYPSPPV